MAEIVEILEEEGSSPASITSPSPSTAVANGDAPHFDVSTFTHTPFYCEENVYFLCKKLSAMGIADPQGFDLFVAVISNEEKKVPLWYQKAGERFDGLVLWDYHVLCIQVMVTRGRHEEGYAHQIVWDLDSCLPLPCPLGDYFVKALQPLSSSNSMYNRLFRVVHAPIFLRCFACDRSHMQDDLGNWISLPPPYTPIVAEDGTENNLNDYIQMRASDAWTNVEGLVDGVFFEKYGVVVSETMLKKLFSQIHLRI